MTCSKGEHFSSPAASKPKKLFSSFQNKEPMMTAKYWLQAITNPLAIYPYLLNVIEAMHRQAL